MIAQDTFTTTMTRLGDALQVRHIATFDLTTCGVEEDAGAVLDSYPDFDQIPVCDDGGEVVGVVERPEQGILSGQVGEVMLRLDLTRLVSCYEPVSAFIYMMERRPFYRLVVAGDKVQGIVTRSDLLKLPVRVVLFARLAHLETLLTARLRDLNRTGDELMGLLNARQRGALKGTLNALAAERSDPPLLEAMSLGQKRTILVKLGQLDETADAELEEIQGLRDRLAHVGDYAPDDVGIPRLIRRLRLMDKWIGELQNARPTFEAPG